MLLAFENVRSCSDWRCFHALVSVSHTDTERERDIQNAVPSHRTGGQDKPLRVGRRHGHDWCFGYAVYSVETRVYYTALVHVCLSRTANSLSFSGRATVLYSCGFVIGMAWSTDTDTVQPMIWLGSCASASCRRWWQGSLSDRFLYSHLLVPTRF
jgi:hypothetical protein